MQHGKYPGQHCQTHAELEAHDVDVMKEFTNGKTLVIVYDYDHKKEVFHI